MRLSLRISQHNDKGFTLIELLVVMLIISLTLTFTILAFGDFGKSRQARMTAEKIHHLLVYLREQAITEAIELQVVFTEKGYTAQLLHPRPGAAKLAHFTTGSFPTGIRVIYQIPSSRAPQSSLMIDIHESGTLTPFIMRFGTQTQANLVQLLGKSNGKIELSSAS